MVPVLSGKIFIFKVSQYIFGTDLIQAAFEMTDFNKVFLEVKTDFAETIEQKNIRLVSVWLSVKKLCVIIKDLFQPQEI